MNGSKSKSIRVEDIQYSEHKLIFKCYFGYNNDHFPLSGLDSM